MAEDRGALVDLAEVSTVIVSSTGKKNKAGAAAGSSCAYSTFC
ncbi:hypothetical protein [Paenibacillus sp. ALJ109b]|nr:hypothetical protein [Paenibacillus sp. ALJ109b]